MEGIPLIETIMIIAIGLIGGVAVGTQAPVAGAMGGRVGGAAASLIVHLGGLIASLLLLIARGGGTDSRLAQFAMVHASVVY